MVECNLAKVEVAGPNPVSRSICYPTGFFHRGELNNHRVAGPQLKFGKENRIGRFSKESR